MEPVEFRAEDGGGGSSGMSHRAGPTTCPGAPEAPGPLGKERLSCPTASYVREYGVGSQNVRVPFTVYDAGSQS